MKPFVLSVIIALSAGCFAQNNDVPTGVRLSPAVNVPSIVLERFRQDFQNVNASWRNEADTGYSASFKDDSTQLPRLVLYNSSGQRLESRSLLKGGSYPKEIDLYYHKRHPTADFVIWQHQRLDKPPRYYGISGADTAWFSDKGEFLRLKRGDQNSTLAPDDRTLLLAIAAVNSRQLALARLAQRKASEKIREEADQLEKSATELRSQLQDLSAQKNLPVDRQISNEDSDALKVMATKNGETFDRQFRSENKLLQKELKQALQRAARKAVDPDLAAWAREKQQ